MSVFEVLENRKLTDNTFVLRTQRPNLQIAAGQCFSLGTADLGINREYSIYSSADDEYIDFLIRRVDGGRVSSRLYDLRPGESVEIGGPYGKFCLNEDQIENKKFLFIASGTGIAPFHSFVKTFSNLDYEIIHGIRYINETYDRHDYLESRYSHAISRPPEQESGKRVTDLLQERDFNPDEIVYLCGNRLMITDCVQILRDRGIHGDAIFMETFF